MRPDALLRINTSVRFEDTDYEGKPSIYLFIFVNPLSGDQKGIDLVHLPIQHFRLRRLPQVQVEIHNILDAEDREAGISRIKLVQSMVKLGQLPPIPQGNLAPAVSGRHIQVWSAGGDGTVMSVVEMLRDVDFDQIFFSCIPFGTGNDFSQVLGWGRTVPRRDILGYGLRHLEELVTERLEHSDAARLDLWEVEMSAHPSGYVKVAGPDREDGHDVSEVKPTGLKEHQQSITRKMSNYMSIGVQGYVGSGFEKHRAGNRLANIMVYTIESAKWVFWRRFPPLTAFIDKMLQNDQAVLQFPDPRKQQVEKHHGDNNSSSDSNDGDASATLAHVTGHPIDFVIQNIPHIWGREVDLWGEAKSGLESVENRAGPTDPATWNPQRANDGRMEVMVIHSLFSYLKKLANIRQHVSRIGQFGTPFEIAFRPPSERSNKRRSLWRRVNRYERDNVICIMCDGEFYILKDPKSLKFVRFAQIWTLGRRDEKGTGRLVLDEHTSSSPLLP
ncbi:ATP-NAD kinase-like domain-containing protein [Zychaea mexicana]|uniref:ATP-NAD kinase-like domain-containing protein n=1 Tax=Zychaea mexicana TaxID=64656 RepID=UPI0022FE96F9|nr:ATP-NAD kinase-like domain-containing protein [Zychaea mexicana]KAI9490259.1 ATP-NAD kinase-like domain-containing protein [Zychaea mexicana]